MPFWKIKATAFTATHLSAICVSTVGTPTLDRIDNCALGSLKERAALLLSQPLRWGSCPSRSLDSGSCTTSCAATRAPVFVAKLTELEPTLVTEENGRDNHSDARTAALALFENGESARCIYQRAAVLTGLKIESADKL
ncbi:hypothetical protein MTO96_041376 [Rhipicephalus appendiculatus]